MAALAAMTDYHLLSFALPAELEEALAADLWAHGTLGLEVRDEAAGRRRIDAYFAAGAVRAEDFAGWLSRGVVLAAAEALADRDYLAAYRASATPIEVGGRFRVDPRDLDDDAAAPAGDGRILLRIPARTAFGTGSHESTRLAIALLETLDLAGRAVLDLGTGSGILAFAALHLGARSVLGFDLDTPSVLVAGDNARRNDLAPRLFAGRLDALCPAPRFDLALVNVLPARIRADLPLLFAVLRPGARVISSGNLRAERRAVLAAWAAHGLAPLDERVEGEWLALVLGRR